MALILRPNVQPLLPMQAEFLRLGLKEKIQRLFVLSGRGWGKSIMATTGAFLAGMQAVKNGRITITYPTFADARDIGRSKIFEVFPASSFVWKESELCAKLRYTNTSIYLRSRETKNASRPPDTGRGATNALVIHEEPAMDRNPLSCHTFNASVRGPGALGVWYVTTPKVGWLRDEVKKFGLGDCGWGVHRGTHQIDDPLGNGKINISGAVIHARTLDNIYGGRELHAHMLSDLDSKWASQELDGLWVTMGGLLWDNFAWEPWPDGNVAEIHWSPNIPWYLSCDFGVTRSSWIAWQRHKVNGENVHVAVAEYHPCGEGVIQSLERIRADLKTRPTAVYSGHDYSTRSVADSSLTPAFHLRKVWPGVKIRGLGGLAMDKSIRHATMRALTESADGKRTFAIARALRSYDPEKRGIKAVLEQDEYGDKTNLMKKDGFLEHCRDAMHHYFSAIDSPTIGRDRRYA